MKARPPGPVARSLAWHAAPLAAAMSCCSWLVLAQLGTLTLAAPRVASAQASRGVLPGGTLPVLRGVVSGQAVVNAPAPGATRPLLTIDQGTQRAIIDWRSFDVGRDAEVLFRHQMGASSSTLNRIHDANPSVIQGRIGSTGRPDANGQPTPGGQVILVNQNGILFDRGAQVNLSSLVASTLNLSNSLFNSGALTGGGLATPAFAGGYDDAGNTLPTRPGGLPPAGMVIGGDGPGDAAAPRLQATPGGSILVFAPRIEHRSGLLSAPDGQVMLAAGHKVYLALNDSADDITLRGLRVEVEAARDGPDLDLGSLIRNAGEITADRGNVTLAALAVNQEGRISARTAVQANGSIFLQAQTKAPTPGGDPVSGRVTLAAGSTTEALPDPADTATLPESQDYAPYRALISATGRTIVGEGTVAAPGGRIVFNASDAADPQGARVYLAAGSVTSVAGSWADVDPSKFLRTITVTSNELKNAPDQKSGLLRGATVNVDLRKEHTILDLDGYRDTIPRTVAEKASAGGELTLSSTGAVIQREGAVLDASGGGYRYAAGSVFTSRLLGADRRIYDLATAPQERTYTAVLDNFERTDPRYGVTLRIPNLSGTVGTFEDAHVQGQRGGAIAVRSAAGLVLDGTLLGGVTVGARQVAAAPVAATLRVGEYLPQTKLFSAEQQIGDVTLRPAAGDTLGPRFDAGTPLDAERRDEVVLAATQLFGSARQTAAGRVESAFGSVEVNANGRIVVPGDVALNTEPGASLALRGSHIDVAGSLRVPAGSLLLQPVTEDVTTPEQRLTVRSGAHLSTAGLWLNQSLVNGRPIGEPLPSGRTSSSGTASSINGGTLTLQIDGGTHQTQLERGAVLDVAGGALLSPGRSLTAGRGGSLTVSTGGASASSSDWMQAELRGFAVASGGSLTLNLMQARIDPEGTIGTLPSDTIRLAPSFFDGHGFGRITLNASKGIELGAGAQLGPLQRNLVIDLETAALQPSGTPIDAVAQVALLPEYQRRPTSVVLNARGGSAEAGRATIDVARGASIQTDVAGEVSLAALDGLKVDGSIVAPGGRIGLTLNASAERPAPDLQLGPTGQLVTSGRFVATPNDRGLVQGTLADGGSVSLEARNAGVRLDAGSLIDVSGRSQVVDRSSTGSRPGIEQVTLPGNAGSVLVKSQGAVVLDGRLEAHAGSARAAGGSFALELTRPDGRLEQPPARRIVLGEASAAAPSVGDTVDAQVRGSRLMAAGFDKLRLRSEDSIEFQGRQSLEFGRALRLDAPRLDLADDAGVALKSAQVALGQSTAPRVLVSPEDGWRVVEGGGSPPHDARPGSGVLSVEAGAIDLYGSFAIDGAALTRLQAEGDLRLIGRPVTQSTGIGGSLVTRQVGRLDTAGSLELHAAQVYPATRTDFTIGVRDDGASGQESRYLLLQGRGEPGTAYSAAGRVTLQAPTIAQAGRLLAPMGEIILQAGKAVELAPEGTTSVSAEGQTVLYGGTRSDVVWQYQDSGLTLPESITRVASEGARIAVEAPAIDIRQGSRVDLRGGGDVLGVEFVPGIGGDSDITLAASTYAIIPAAQLRGAPYDAHLQTQRDAGVGFSLANGRDGTIYDSIVVGAGAPVAAGTYALLPARYALLPGAYLVQLHTGPSTRNLTLGQTVGLANGQAAVAAFRTALGTGVQEAQSIGAVIQPGPAAIQRASDYNLNGAAFFAEAAELERTAPPRAPWDAARLRLSGAGTLSLDGSFLTSATAAPGGAAGRLAEVDIAGERLAIVERPAEPASGSGVLQIGAEALSRLDASVLVGGTRSDIDGGVNLVASARSVTVATGASAPVRLPELLIAASERIDIRTGSELRAASENATAPAGEAAPLIRTEGPGALVRLSARGQARLERSGASDTSGDVRVEAGATLKSDRALLIDATRSTTSRGVLQAGGADGSGGSLALNSTSIALGETGAVPDSQGALVLPNSELARFASLDELVLRGYSGITLIGKAELGAPTLARLELDTPMLLAAASPDGAAPAASVAASQITLRNSGSASVPPTGAAGSGSLRLSAQRVELAEGSKALEGYADVRIGATGSIVGRGAGELVVAAPLRLDTPSLRAAGGSLQVLRAEEVRAQSSASTPASAAAPDRNVEFAAGGRLTIAADSVHIDTSVQASSGAIELRAGGATGSVTLGPSGRLDVAGVARDFNGTAVAADAGRVSLQAEAGAVSLQAGSVVDLSAHPAGRAAGRLEVSAASFAADGRLEAEAPAAGRGGTASLDLGRADFQTLNQALNAGGFSYERRLRLREGDLRIDAGERVAAERVFLAADRGKIEVAGTVGSGAAAGGARVELAAARGVTLAAGSLVQAQGSEPGAAGGRVRVSSADGALDFDAGARIDLRAGPAGAGGSLTFGVPRDAQDRIAGNPSLRGTVLRHGDGGAGAGQVQLEATRQYTASGQLGAAEIESLAADHTAFAGGAPAQAGALLGGLRDERGALDAARLTGATEVRSTAGLTVAAPWDLTDGSWLTGGLPGTLTLRAAGELRIGDALGGGRSDDPVGDHRIVGGDTWNLRLVAGADLGAADPLTTSTTAGAASVVLAGPNARVRTGTGGIDVAASGDIRLEHVGATIFTAGRIGAADTAAGGNDRWGVDGGDIGLRAGGDIVGATGAAGELWINEWLRRPRLPNTQFAALQPTDWWSYRPRFQQAVGTLAGGDVEISAGGSLRNLSVMLPTTGRTWRDADGQRQVDVQGGGDLSIAVGGDIVGGGYLVGRGEARIEAGGDVGADRPVQLYLMGTSSGATPAQATVTVSAGRSLHLQSIANPTALFMPNRDLNDTAAVGPSFGGSGGVPTFFTYSANSAAHLVAESGDLDYQGVLARPARVLNRTAITSAQTDLPGAYPASLLFAALDGDIGGPPLVDRVTTFPSADAQVAMLAAGSLRNVGFHASDRDPSSVVTTTSQTDIANGFAARQIDGSTGLQARSLQPRIVERARPDGGFAFQLQALEGSILTEGTATDIAFPAPGLLYAGTDIVGVALRMQNLLPDDLSVIRAAAGDFRAPLALEIRGPGRLLLQAGRNIDLGTATLAQGSAGDIGGLVATGNAANPSLRDQSSARLTLVAGTPGALELPAMDAAYAEIIDLNQASKDIVALYDQLAAERDPAFVLAATDIAWLARINPEYQRFVALDERAPDALARFQTTLRREELPLTASAASAQALELYRLLNLDEDLERMRSAGSLAALAAQPGGEPYGPFVELSTRYPLIYGDYAQRRTQGARPKALTPIVFSQLLDDVAGRVVAPEATGSGSIFSFGTSIQTYGGSDIDLWAPGGNIVVGLTTPGAKTVGVLTNTGGAIRSVLSGNLDINQGKVITAQGGDIMMFTSAGSIDAGRGAKTSLTTAAPQRRPILDEAGNVIGVEIVIPASATGSGIQTLSSDPDGLGPRAAPAPGSVYLFAPAGTIDAGEAGIRSSGNIVLNAQSVRNAANISASGSVAGAPVQLPSLAAALAAAGPDTSAASKAAEESAKAAEQAARQAAAARPPVKPTVLSVEVLGFGDRNCREDDKDCLGK